MSKSRNTRRVVNFIVADSETDPFEYRIKPEVFLMGVCDGEQTIQWWGDSAVSAFCEFLRSRKEKTYVFFHNGGKFDFFYLPWPLDDPIKIINGRIASAKIGRHTLRDSFCILPFALSAYKKTEINYEKFRAEVREKHKQEILSYHRDDLRNTYELVAAFIKRFGLRLTIAGTAIRELNKFHPVERKGESHDEKFRPYYFGGRVECFERGRLPGKWRSYDVNSMYPFVMANRNHPMGKGYEFTTNATRLLQTKAPGFATITGYSRGAFPTREKDGALTFPHGYGKYRVTLYEWREAHSLGLFECDEVHEGYISQEHGNFREFVQVFSEEKIKAKLGGDKIGELFAKLMLNSAYGKFGANPENYYDYRFILGNAPFPEGWDIFEDWGWMLVIRRPSPIRAQSYYDVATAASITGAARAMLLRAIHNAKRPIYCDTDSIICESLNEPQGSLLGQWKLEAEADSAVILEKKLYVLSKKGEVVKSAHKGVKMTLKNYLDVARGKDYIYSRDAPTFKKDGSATFIKRIIKARKG